MADIKAKSLDAEPAVRKTAANKDLVVKNSIASERWLRIRNSLDRQKKQFENKVNVDRSALLKKRERLQVTSTLPKATPDTSSTGQSMTVVDVYDALMKSAKEQKNSLADLRSVQSEPHHRRESTVSFESKRITRKPANFSLQSLQREQSNLQTKLQTLAKAQEDAGKNEEQKVEESSPPLGPFELNEEEKSLGPKLQLPPTILPPIRDQKTFTPGPRNFEKNRLQIWGERSDLDDVKYCRYLRRGRNSAPIARPGINAKHIKKKTRY